MSGMERLCSLCVRDSKGCRYHIAADLRSHERYDLQNDCIYVLAELSNLAKTGALFFITP